MKSLQKTPLKSVSPHSYRRKNPTRQSLPSSQNNRAVQICYSSRFCETSLITFQANIFVIQRFLHSTPFSLWETRETDIQGELNLSHQRETKILHKQASLKVMRLKLKFLKTLKFLTGTWVAN